MKRKFQSMDVRTGHKEGEIVELTDDELNKLPFNVFMKLVDEEKEKDKVEENTKQKAKDELRNVLLNKGLSTQRTDSVVEKYGSLEELKKNVDNAKIDELTDEWLKKELGKTLSQKPKKEEKKKESDE